MQYRVFKKSLTLFLFVLWLPSCDVDKLPRAKKKVEASMAELLKLYNKRLGLIPSLVKTVQRKTSKERNLLANLQAKAKSPSLKINPKKASIKGIKRFQKAQNIIGGMIVRLWVSSERYPKLNKDHEFLALQRQIRQLEIKIKKSRGRLNKNIRYFNSLISVPPSSWINGIFYNYTILREWEERD